MKNSYIRFYEELNDFLPLAKRKLRYAVYFNNNPNVKSIIESEGVPHTEVDLILINGNSVSFKEKVKDNDDLSVYPVFESFDIASVQLIRLMPLREPKFVLDIHLGKLARYLRMLGFDTLYSPGYSDDVLLGISLNEKRSVLSRDKRLLMRKELERGYWIRNENILEQVKEVILRFDLKNSICFFSRCTKCNCMLLPVDNQTVKTEFPEHNFFPGTLFYQCERCHHTFWNGSHCERFVSAIGTTI